MAKDQMNPIIFEQGKDPGEGYLRIVGNLAKIEKVESDRSISFREIHEVMFSKGRSAFLEEYQERKEFNGEQILERQFRIIGLTRSGKPVVVVFTPRDKFGVAKRIITAWKPSRKSKEIEKLLKDCPHLKDELSEA